MQLSSCGHTTAPVLTLHSSSQPRSPCWQPHTPRRKSLTLLKALVILRDYHLAFQINSRIKNLHWRRQEHSLWPISLPFSLGVHTASYPSSLMAAPCEHGSPFSSLCILPFKLTSRPTLSVKPYKPTCYDCLLLLAPEFLKGGMS